jgi:cupin 2 domain-containing protein
MRRGNLRDGIPPEFPEELTTVLIDTTSVLVERIVSRGHASADGFWYDQKEHERVLLVQGAALREMEGSGEFSLRAGDWIDIPAHTRHRVTWTDPDVETIWLAMFYPP